MFTCGVPRNLVTFDHLVGLDQAIFGNNSLAPDRARDLFRRRPEIYTAILKPTGQLVAYSIIYPLKPEWAQHFIEGSIGESDFTPEMILDREVSHEGQHFHIGSVVVDSASDPIMRSVFLAGLLRWWAYHLDSVISGNATFLMGPVTAGGMKLVRHVHAIKLSSGENRKDGHDLYGLTTTTAFLHRLSAAIDSFLDRELVQLNLDFRAAMQG